MVALDTNLLIYAHRTESPWHRAAYRVIQDFLDGQAPWALPWPCLHEFLSITTHSRVFAVPTPVADALETVDTWLRATNLTVLSEGDGYFESLRAVMQEGRVSGPRVHDARIAALCLHHGVSELWSADRDFSRFPRLKVRNPLVGR